jgi:ABC-type polysaccharide/polyol phosphate transport system ATPase subunit
VSAPWIEVEAVSKAYCRRLRHSLFYGLQDIGREVLGVRRARDELRAHEFWSLKDVSLSVRPGECVGLIGRNGAGKTTLLKLINGLVKPDQGRVTVRGRVGALIALGAGFNPILTGRENVYVNGSVLGLTKREVDAKLGEILDFAELGDAIDAPVQSYSSGMFVRLGFAVATALDPDVLLIDEVLAVGDTGFRAKCFQRLGELLPRTATIFVSHQMTQVERVCDRVLLLEGGRAAFLGAAVEASARYRAGQDLASPERLLLGEDVDAFKLGLGSEEVAYGGTLALDLELELARPLKGGLCVLSLVRGGAVAAQVDLTALVGDLEQGGNRRALRLGPLQLVGGTYDLNLSLNDEGGKATLVHALSCGRFNLSGPAGFGVSAMPPVEVRSEAS